MKRLLILLAAALGALSAPAVAQVIDMDGLAASDGVYLSQNAPNPFHGTTDVCLAVTKSGEVSLVVADLYGHVRAMHTAALQSGIHRFRVTLTEQGTFLLGAHGQGRSSIVMLCEGKGGSGRFKGEVLHPYSHGGGYSSRLRVLL